MIRICPICNVNPLKNPSAKMCRSCYMKSDAFLARVRSQAKRANIAANKARWGEKQANDWTFTQVTLELAYIVGVYLTDGWMNIARHTIGLDVTSESFAAHFRLCATVLGLEVRTGLRTKHAQTHKGKKPIHRTSFYSRNLCQWLFDNCGEKQHIPAAIVTADVSCQIAFISGAIDGDGMISAWDGTIAIYGTKSWMSELPNLLDQIGIRTGGYTFVKTLPSGKGFYRVSVHRQDFIDRSGFSAIDYKKKHLDQRPQPNHKYDYDECPLCGRQKGKRAKLCRYCWRNNKDMHTHMKSISPLGNAAHKRHS